MMGGVFGRALVVAVIMLGGIAPVFAQAQIASSREYKTVTHGHRVKIASLIELNPDCSSMGVTTVNLLREPQDGAVETTQGRDYPYFVPQNIRAGCNRRLVPATQLFYHANPNSTFDGVDTFDVEVVYPNGTARKIRYAVVVH